MAMWLYQMSEDIKSPEQWPINEYRLEVWEGERQEFSFRTIRGSEIPQPGDTIVFYYAKTACDEPGFYGWAVIAVWKKKQFSLPTSRSKRPTQNASMVGRRRGSTNRKCHSRRILPRQCDAHSRKASGTDSVRDLPLDKRCSRSNVPPAINDPTQHHFLRHFRHGSFCRDHFAILAELGTERMRRSPDPCRARIQYSS